MAAKIALGDQHVVSMNHRVARYLQLRGQLPGGWQEFAGDQLAALDQALQLARKLNLQRDRTFFIQEENFLSLQPTANLDLQQIVDLALYGDQIPASLFLSRKFVALTAICDCFSLHSDIRQFRSELISIKILAGRMG